MQHCKHFLLQDCLCKIQVIILDLDKIEYIIPQLIVNQMRRN